MSISTPRVMMPFLKLMMLFLAAPSSVTSSCGIAVVHFAVIEKVAQRIHVGMGHSRDRK